MTASHGVSSFTSTLSVESKSINDYLAYSTALVSRITVTLICPGYWSSSSI